jgi:hypothetical protein
VLHVRHAGHLVQHGQVAEHGGGRLVVEGGRHPAGAEPREQHGDRDGEQERRVEPEDATDPEVADAAAPFDGGGHDVAADQEEQHHAEGAGVRVLAGGEFQAGDQVAAEVLVDDGQDGDPA